MPKLITLTIDGQTVTAPAGTIIVDAARQVGIDIPVFCYHPKLHPVGMCRMCLVEIGRPVIDRTTNQALLDPDGKPQVQFGPKLETSCTTPISEGMVVVTNSEKVVAARKDVVEFLLTSHPLDCPICDKGGECPLQNLTMAHGPAESRFLLDEKYHLAKHLPLGDLIYLDRERCIQCSRCVRFQDELAGDPVIGFYNRGRAFEIVTFSDPGFDSHFSGNTTDICPVGALTTADFRFQARPWELKATASICPHCPVGCNLTFNVRREARSGGRTVIKRAMPRQNEAINEIWICDKGRFAYHYTESPERLSTPLVRQGGELVPASWDVALAFAAEGLRQAGKGLLTLGSGRLSNEDLFVLRQLADGLKGKSALYTQMAGADLTARYGVVPGTNFASMGPETAILVVASDLYEEAPIWYLRIKQAAERGANLIVANARPTKLERYAKQVVRLDYRQKIDLQPLRGTLAQSENAVILFGSEGQSLGDSMLLAQSCADLLDATGHVGRVNNGLIGVWSRANEQGAWDMGLRPPANLHEALKTARGIYLAGADPFGDIPALLATLHEPLPTFMVVQDLFLTESAKRADVVLPAQAYTEREGTFTSGERRVQRFYPAVSTCHECRPDYAITAQLGAHLGLHLEGRTAAAIFAQIAAQIPIYAGLSYRRLAAVSPQQPLMGRGDLYYGGTSYENSQGLGVQLPLAADEAPSKGWELFPLPMGGQADRQGFLAVPVARLYDCGQMVWPSTLLHDRIGSVWAALHPADAASLGLAAGEQIVMALRDQTFEIPIRLDDGVPPGVVLIPRSMGIPLHEPVKVELCTREKVT
ncbi:MAG: NADH-quinone oxidoreductase subunit NuoG [Chloroflexota bacterium]